MKSTYLETAKHALIFGLGNLGNRVLGFLLLPIYTSYLSTADYGLLAIVNVTSSLLSIVLQVGLSTSIFKYYFSTDDLDQRKEAISTALFWLFGIGSLFLVIFWSLAPIFSLLLFGTEGYALYMRVMFFTLVFTLIQTIPFTLFRAQKKSWQYALFSVTSFAVGGALNIYFVAFAQLGVLGVLLASLITAIIFGVAGIFLCRREIVISFSLPIIRALLRYGLPLVPSGIGSFVLIQSDRYFLQHFSTMSHVGLYSLSYQFGMVINLLLVQPFQLVWLPTAFEMEKRPDARRFYESMLTYFLLFASWVALGLSLLGKEIVTLMTAPGFHEAYKTIPWIAYSYVVYGGYMVVNIGIYLKNRTSYAMWMLGGAAIANLALNLVLIPRLDIMGAALATLLSYIFLLVVSWQVNRRIFPLCYEWGRIFKLGVIAVILLIVGQFAPDKIIVAGLTKCVLLVAFWVLLLALGFFKEDELAIVRRRLDKLLRRWPQEVGESARRHITR